MDYKDLIKRLKSETYWLGSSEPYSHDVHPVICDEAVTAITELLSRAEAAEKCISRFRELMGADLDWLLVVHGRWEPYHKSDFGWDEYGVRCTNCKLEVENKDFTFPGDYCPHCGAKMDGGGII